MNKNKQNLEDQWHVQSCKRQGMCSLNKDHPAGTITYHLNRPSPWFWFTRKSSPLRSCLNTRCPWNRLTLTAIQKTSTSSKSTLTISLETKAPDILNQFCRNANAYYVEAKRSTVSGIVWIPRWIYGILVVWAILFWPIVFHDVCCQASLCVTFHSCFSSS